MSQHENVLPATIVRAIGDKLYDRRKTAALGVEGLVKNLAAQVRQGLLLASLQVSRQNGPFCNSKASLCHLLEVAFMTNSRERLIGKQKVYF